MSADLESNRVDRPGRACEITRKDERRLLLLAIPAAQNWRGPSASLALERVPVASAWAPHGAAFHHVIVRWTPTNPGSSYMGVLPL
jgi:hypothetical protein